ncbi:MAG: carbohydrate ABC transporter permease [Candidatus Limiplasma sp.]|nr:carbohydrate ABC transporter permease [Candidatus Limiplasma sp.]
MAKKAKVFTKPGMLLAWLCIAILVVVSVYPILYALLGSLKTNAELTLGGSILPKEFKWSNYSQAFVTSNFGLYSRNSLVISVITMLIAMLTCSLVGYVLARFTFFGKKVMLVMYSMMMFVSIGSVALYPIKIFLSRFTLDNTLLALILVLTGSQITNVFLVMGFVKGVPRELDEAACIDGCSIFSTYWRIILPLIRPILGVVALFTFRNTWNDYITTLIMTMSNKSMTTLTVAVVQLKYSVSAAAEWHIMLAGASIAIIPILILYIVTNKQFIAGLTAGAVKG